MGTHALKALLSAGTVARLKPYPSFMGATRELAASRLQPINKPIASSTAVLAFGSRLGLPVASTLRSPRRKF